MPESTEPLSKTELEFDVKAARLQQRRLFYACVGQGISEWARMEERLVEIGSKLLRTTEKKAGLVFYSIINFHTWIDIIDELFELDGTYTKSQSAWRKLVHTLRRENNIRVQLAHHALDLDIKIDPENHSVEALSASWQI